MEVMLECMVPDEITKPTGEDLAEMADGFQRLCGMLCCVGAVDGNFFHLQAPRRWSKD